MGQPSAEIFKAYDIRGIVDKTLTADAVTLIGQALGTLAQESNQSSIIIGRDGRLSGPKLSQALASGIISSGCDVIDIGMAPTGLVYYATYKLDSQCAVALTGSHNPPDYNGLKMVIAGDTLSGEQIQDIKSRIERNQLATGQGQIREEKIIPAYIAEVTSQIKLKRPLKIVVDSGNGVAGIAAPRLFRQLGCEVTELYCDVDGHFPNHHPDPGQPKNLVDLINKVREVEADIGFGFDGDGDRVGAIAPNGDIIWPDRQMILFSRDILSRNPGATIIFDVKCSQLLPQEIERAGGKPLMWRTGHSLIKKKMKQTNALLAGEMSGHIFFKDGWYGFDDGLYAGARLCELLSRSADIQETFDLLPNSINTPELLIHKEKEGEQHELINKLTKIASFPDAKISTIDGLRVDYADGFGLARASNTTPSIVIRFEGKDEKTIKRIQLEFKELFAQLDPDMELPF